MSVDRVPSDRKLSAGQTVTIKIVSVAYTKGVPDITGELVSTKVKLTVSHLGEVAAGWLVGCKQKYFPGERRNAHRAYHSKEEERRDQ